MIRMLIIGYVFGRGSISFDESRRLMSRPKARQLDCRFAD
jgi:hypothetical protein